MAEKENSEKRKTCCAPTSGRAKQDANEITTVTERSDKAGETSNMTALSGGNKNDLYGRELELYYC